MEAATAVPEKKKSTTPAIPFGAVGSKASFIKFTQTIQFHWGMADQIAMKPPEHKAYTLVAEEITLTAIGAVCTMKPVTGRPSTIVVYASSIQYALPAEE